MTKKRWGADSSRALREKADLDRGCCKGRSKDSAYHRSLLSSTVCMDVTIYPVLVFVLSFFGLALSAWIGVLFSRNRGVEAQVREDFGIILAATLTLLGLIVGFTFSMALGRYDQRKNYEEEEANAIGTEYIAGRPAACRRCGESAGAASQLPGSAYLVLYHP